MSESMKTCEERSVRVGVDQVMITKTAMVIHAKHEIPDWEVRGVRPPAIYFEDRKYLLVKQSAGTKPYRMCYVLHPWPEGKAASDKAFYTYDEAFVRERDAAHRDNSIDSVIYLLLLPLYPLLGFLWSGAQERLIRFGFIPRAITGASIFTCFAAVFMQGIMICVLLNARMIGGIVRAFVAGNYFHLGQIAIPVAMIDVVIFVSSLLDLLVRYTRYLRDPDWTGGFLEWVRGTPAGTGRL